MVSDSEMIEQRLEASAGVVPVLSLENTVLLPHSLQLLRITASLDCVPQRGIVRSSHVNRDARTRG